MLHARRIPLKGGDTEFGAGRSIAGELLHESSAGLAVRVTCQDRYLDHRFFTGHNRCAVASGLSLRGLSSTRCDKRDGDRGSSGQGHDEIAKLSLGE